MVNINKNLFLDGIFDGGLVTPSAVYITMPNKPKGSFYKDTVVGLMVGDPTWGASNKWGPVISDLSNFQDWASLIGAQSQVSWISTSTMCWKGTTPLSISIEFYLINYSGNLRLEEKLATLMKLAAISTDPNASGIRENFSVNVHGGYAADILTGNKEFFTRGKDINSLISGKQGKAASALEEAVSKLYDEDGNAYGAVTLTFGHKSSVSNLLLEKINVTESTIEVADQDGGNIKPLYYRVSAQFTGVRPLITTDVDSMFNTSLSGGTPSFTGPTFGGGGGFNGSGVTGSV